ncbi:MAG: hypothetical protein ACERJ1_16750 [Halodesulfovibrio sp.]|uniref:DUF6890 family protein n=1 Tax=Halodesulfovibrio sp. TaxID=1912772 RepID=UPI00359E6A9F
MEHNALEQMLALTRKWFPERDVTERCMGEAMFLEKDYWHKMEIAVCNGIAKAFGG